MSTSTYNSDIKFGLHNNAERNSWAAYQLFVLISSLFGDTLILVASFTKDAFKINKLIVTAIQHIAVCDLINSISFALPQATTLLANSWMLGKSICNAQPYLIYFINPVSACLIAVLTTFKFLILRCPLRTTSWSSKRAHQVCGFMWASSAISPILMLAKDKGDTYIDYRIYHCLYYFNDEIWTVVLPMMALIFMLAPPFVVISTTVPTLKYLMTARKSARRSRGRIPWQGALTVVLTALIYTISTVPTTLYQILKKFVKGQEDPNNWFHITFARISSALLLMNVMANFYIYCLTIRSFRRFLLSRTQLVVSVTLRSTGNTADPHLTGNDLHLLALFKKPDPGSRTSSQTRVGLLG